MRKDRILVYTTLIRRFGGAEFCLSYGDDRLGKKNLVKLNRYRHSVLIGKVKNDCQDRDYVLKWFVTKEGEANVSPSAIAKTL